MRQPIIAGNWKMNNTIAATKALLTDLIPLVADAKAEVVVCVPYTNIAAAGELVKGTNIKLGAENVHWAEKGAFTGEISADMLVELGVEYVIIGHSERRQYFGETDAQLIAKTRLALDNGLTPIFCVGEVLEQRENGTYNEVVKSQVEALFCLSSEDFAKVIVAYEPVWAIGTGKTATAEQAEEVCAFIRGKLADLYGNDVAQAVTVQYGGSMNAGNAAELLAKENIDGGLIGGASLKAPDFAEIVKAATNG